MLEWLQNPYVAIAVAIGAMFFGYFFGLFEGRGQGYKRRKEEEAEKVENDAPDAPVEVLQPTGTVLPPDETPLLDVSRNQAGDIHVTLDGQRIEMDAINPEQRKRIIAVLTEIRPWLEAAAPAPAPARPAPVQPAPVRPAPVPAARADAPPAKANDEAAAPPSSIVAQIDEILQAQLAGTPLVERAVRLQESPEGGVIVWVGMDKYEGIEDVPDDQIKAALRAAITAWENKYTPNL